MNSTQRISIKEWAEDDRPREKLLLKGRKSLSDAELIAILIGSGNDEESAVELSKRILRETASNNLDKLASAEISELMKFRGIGEAKAISIIAAMELSRRRNSTQQTEKPKIISSADAFNSIKDVLLDLPHEEFWVIHLNRACQVVGKIQIGRGGISGTVADVRLIYKSAIEYFASAIILAHNHPSGVMKPSDADISLTKRVKEAGKLLDIELFDHIIVGNREYFSFTDEGLI